MSCVDPGSETEEVSSIGPGSETTVRGLKRRRYLV